MKIRYDKEIDSKYIEITSSKRKVFRTKKEKDWLLFDYDEKGKAIGIEILDASIHPTAFMIEDTEIEYFPVGHVFMERKHGKDDTVQDFLGEEKTNETDLILGRETMAI